MTALVANTLLTAEEAADVLRLSRPTVYRLIREGRLRAAKLGSGPCARVRIRADELDRFIEDASAGVGDGGGESD